MHIVSGEGNWIHAYTASLSALLLNRANENFDYPRLWIAEGDMSSEKNRGKRVSCTRLTTIREMPMPTIAVNHKGIANGCGPLFITSTKEEFE